MQFVGHDVIFRHSVSQCPIIMYTIYNYLTFTINILLTLFLSLVEPTNGKVEPTDKNCLTTTKCARRRFESKNLVQNQSFPVTLTTGGS